MKSKQTRLGPVKITIGNSELGPDTAIFNFGSYQTCPSMILKLCKVWFICMGIWMETRLPKTIQYKEEQGKYWIHTPKEDILKHWVQFLKKDRDINYIRWGELGDFWSQRCVWRQAWIAKRIYEKYGVVSYGYTSRSDLEYENHFPYLILKGSGHDKCANGITRVLYPDDEIPSGYILCRKAHGESCYGCKICKHTNANVAFRLHGPPKWVNSLVRKYNKPDYSNLL